MNCQATRDFDWNSLEVPEDTVWVHYVDEDGNVITVSPGGGDNRLPSIFDAEGQPLDRYAMEFADGEVRWHKDLIDVDLPEWASGLEDTSEDA